MKTQRPSDLPRTETYAIVTNGSLFQVANLVTGLKTIPMSLAAAKRILRNLSVGA